ncbi:MAG: hypothetical protein JKY94_10955 [Rhodobacteraceae bacterium]|nr:hypothetical protein [Paracoccaceae bacterium]
MQESLRLFSNFVSKMNECARDTDAQGLARWAVEELSQTLGYDCAWYGWAELLPGGVEIHANSTLNLPDHYFDTWSGISEQDLLAAGVWNNPGRASSYDRAGSTHTDGMVALSDTYGLRRMATAMHLRPGRVASFYLSGYRSGQTTVAWSGQELDFLQCAVEQISTAMRLSGTELNAEGHPNAVSILVNKNGIGILGLQNLRAQLGEFWPDWDGDRLPECLRMLLDQPGEHILTDRNLLVTSQDAPGCNNMGLRKLTLRFLTRFDLLTHREREVARTLADGKSHKETARILGVAPATIRNQTQSIYTKLNVDNRANLVVAVNEQSWL